MDHKPSVRNVICTAQDYLTFVENCPPFNNAPGVAANADQLRQQITDYNTEVHAGKGRNPGQAAFEDKHAKALMTALKTSLQLASAASTNPNLKNYVVDGGGSEWNRQNPLKLTNHLRGLVQAETLNGTRAPSAYHGDGPMEYEAHGGYGVLRVRNPDQTLSPAKLPTAQRPATVSKPLRV
jgi:hypothetical protein